MLNNYGVIGGCLIVGLCFLFASIILKCFKCRVTESKSSTAGGQSNVESGLTSHPSSIIRVSEDYNIQDYESINEAEMIPCVLNFIQIRESYLPNDEQLKYNGSQFSNITHPSSHSSSSNSPDEVYLQVIADENYLNPYQMIKTDDGLENEHIYCQTSNVDLQTIDNFECHTNHSSNSEQINCEPTFFLRKNTFANIPTSNEIEAACLSHEITDPCMDIYIPTNSSQTKSSDDFTLDCPLEFKSSSFTEQNILPGNNATNRDPEIDRFQGITEIPKDAMSALL